MSRLHPQTKRYTTWHPCSVQWRLYRHFSSTETIILLDLNNQVVASKRRALLFNSTQDWFFRDFRGALALTKQALLRSVFPASQPNWLCSSELLSLVADYKKWGIKMVFLLVGCIFMWLTATQLPRRV